MASFNVVVDHDLERGEVVQRLKTFSRKIREQTFVEISELTESWDESGNLDFSFKAAGFRISGNVVTNESCVIVEGKLPFAALPFRGAIENQVADKIREAMAHGIDN